MSETGSDLRLSVAGIADAYDHIDPMFKDTPQFIADAVSTHLGCTLVLKLETANPIRSFKARGALTFVSRLAGTPHLVCVTAGNFGQGIAYAARMRNLRFTAFAPAGANPGKIARMKALGADVRQPLGDLDEVYGAARAFADAEGALLVIDGAEPSIAEGAGTIGLELDRWRDPLDVVLVPLGDGALLNGVATWFKARRPATKMIGICASGAPAMLASWRNRAVTSIDPRTIADGIAIKTPFRESLTDLVRLIDDIVTVDDDAILEAMRLGAKHLSTLLEPAGAVGLAALLSYRERFVSASVATILTGANPSVDQRTSIAS